ncbi:MAG TPA: SGNH/GDSL hydrolase family protein, partial [Bradyrhizobium sp.]|nr:SGNH/GDSL hydrolase family protein [Bradyrhizobium sp.]
AMQRIFEDATQILSRPLISGVSVETASPLGIVVAFGDSITDGNRLAPDILSGWPERLGKRLAARASDRDYCVINAGIGGNRLLASGWGEAGLGRLDRDVLRIEGVSHLILLEGLNDIGMSGPSPFGDNPAVSPEDLISGYRQVIARARARGIRVIIGTNTPFGDSPLFSPDNEAIRQAVNQWIRTSGEADGVIDFEQAIRDPAHPQRLRDEYDSGDHVHPSETGYRAMGDAIDLSLFT